MKRGIENPRLIRYGFYWHWDHEKPNNLDEYDAGCIEHLMELVLKDIKKCRYGVKDFSYKIIGSPHKIKINGLKDYWIQKIYTSFKYVKPNYNALDKTTGAVSDAYLYGTEYSTSFTSEVRWKA